MDHRKYERLRGKAANIFDETFSLRSRLSLCRRHFFSGASEGRPSLSFRSPFQEQHSSNYPFDARQMTLSLSVAATPLFAFTDRQAANLWATSHQSTSAEQNDNLCLDNFLRAIDGDLESVVKV